MVPFEGLVYGIDIRNLTVQDLIMAVLEFTATNALEFFPFTTDPRFWHPTS